MALTAEDGFARSAFLGMVAGFVSALSGHPLDTLKTRMQTQNLVSAATPLVEVKPRPAWNVLNIQAVTLAARSLTANPRLLWRGLGPQLVSVPISWSLNFAAYGKSLEIVGESAVTQHFVAGAMSGFIWALCISPFELLKIRAQHSGCATPEIWRGLWHSEKTALGVARALSHGWQVAVVRDMLGLGVWFAVYHVAKRDWNMSPFLSGGLCASACWVTVMPIDLVKTRCQLDPNLRLADVILDVARKPGEACVTAR